MNDPEVKKWLEKGYEIYEVYESDDVFWVCILTQEQRLPWVTGITLMVPVYPLNGHETITINFELTLATLTEEQKQQVLSIATDYASATYPSSYEQGHWINGVGTQSWTECSGGKCSFYAYPWASIGIGDPNGPGLFLNVYVDLDKGEVVNVFESWRKPLPS